MKKIVFIVLFLVSLSSISCKKDKEAPAPVADFTFDTTGLSTGECLLSTENKSQNASTFSWYVTQDGRRILGSSEKNPTFKIKNNGTYKVELIARGEGSSENSKTRDLNVSNALFGEAKGPNSPDLSWIADDISMDKNSYRLYLSFNKYYNTVKQVYDESIDISLPLNVAQGKTYDISVDNNVSFSFRSVKSEVLTMDQTVGSITITKLTSTTIEGTFFFTIKDQNNNSISFNSGKFKAALP